MGVIISKIRGKKKDETTLEKLERLESQIRELENGILLNRRKEKKVWTTFLFATGFIYVSVAGFLHAFILPRDTNFDILKLTLIWTIPAILIYVLQRWIPWYFNRSISANREKLKSLRESKQKLLDHVRENEPYNKAKVILEKYESHQPSPPKQIPPRTPSQTPRTSISTISSTPRQSLNLGQTIQPAQFVPGQSGPQSANSNLQRIAVVQRGVQYPPQFPVGRAPMGNRSAFDRLLDYVVKDGPENRMALICRACATHNGLCLMEEFEYIGFRCFTCKAVNPPRKQRPQAAAPARPSFTPSASVVASPSSEESSESSEEEENTPTAERPNNSYVAPRTVARDQKHSGESDGAEATNVQPGGDQTQVDDEEEMKFDVADHGLPKGETRSISGEVVVEAGSREDD